jgi:type II secretory pathway component PulJ
MRNPIKAGAFTGKRAQRGTSLWEVMVATAVGGALGVIIVGMLFQLTRTASDGRGQTDVTTYVLTSNRWLTRDIRMAATTDLPDGGSGLTSAQFAWDDSGTPVSCLYDLTGNSLTRTCGPDTVVVARGASGLTFARTGSLVTAEFTVTSVSRPDYSETVEFNVAMRGG